MAKFVNNLDLNGLQLLNAVIQNLAVAPSNPTEGRLYYNTVDKKLKWHNGTEWVNADSSDAQLDASDIISSINASEGMIDYQRIDGLSQMLQKVSMSSGQIIDAINEEVTKTIQQSRIEGLADALAIKEDVGTASNEATTALNNAKAYVDEEIVKALNTIQGGAGEAYDTFAELQQFIESHQGQIDELLNASHKHSEAIGDGVATEHTINHNLGSMDVTVSLREVNAPYQQLFADIEFTDENNILVRTAKPIESGAQIQVTVVG